MTRRLLSLLTALSLLLCVALSVVCLASLDGPVGVRLPGFDLGARGGNVFLSGTTATPGEVRWRWMGFSFIRTHRTYTPAWSLHVPLWPLITATAAGAAAKWWRGDVVRHRRRAGQCPSCGYDPRATPDKCPECGASPS